MVSGMRIGGLASGFDTENTVAKLMEAEKVKYNKFYQTRQSNIWKREVYNSFNKDVANFINSSSKDLGITRSTFGQIYDSAKNNMTWVKKATPTDSTVATATAGSGTTAGSYSLEVTDLASGVKVSSAANLSIADPNADSFWDATGKITKNGKIEIEVKDANGVARKTSPIEYKSGDSLSDFFNKIRSATYKDTEGKDVSVNLNVYAESGKLFISSKNTGANSYVKINDTEVGGVASTEGLIKHMNIVDVNNQKITDGIAGKNASVKIDGSTFEYSSNQFVFNNMTVILSKKGTTDINVSVNVDDAYKKIKEFVDNYNKIIDGVNKKTTEKVYRDYKPLLEDQRKSMNEDDIKLWEEKSKSGLLKNDELLNGMVSGVRSWIYEKVQGASGTYSAAYDIGIETTSNYKEPGKLQVNEKKLREALANDPESVMDVLFKNASGISKDEKNMTTAEVTDKRRQSGLINRIYDEMIVGMKKIVTKAGAGEDPSLLRSVQSTILLEFTTKGAYGKGNESFLDKDITGLDKLMDLELNRLKSREDSYWSRFTAMEKAISNMNSQSSWIGSQMGR